MTRTSRRRGGRAAAVLATLFLPACATTPTPSEPLDPGFARDIYDCLYDARRPGSDLVERGRYNACMRARGWERAPRVDVAAGPRP